MGIAAGERTATTTTLTTNRHLRLVRPRADHDILEELRLRSPDGYRSLLKMARAALVALDAAQRVAS